MAAFDAMSKDGPWPLKPGPILVDDIVEHVAYANEDTRLQIPKHDWKLKKETVAPRLFEEAVVWPKDALRRSMATPFVAAGVTACFGAPAIDPTGGIGAMLLSGYIAGAAVYLMQMRSWGKVQSDALPGARDDGEPNIHYSLDVFAHAHPLNATLDRAAVAQHPKLLSRDPAVVELAPLVSSGLVA